MQGNLSRFGVPLGRWEISHHSVNPCSWTWFWSQCIDRVFPWNSREYDLCFADDWVY